MANPFEILNQSINANHYKIVAPEDRLNRYFERDIVKPAKNLKSLTVSFRKGFALIVGKIAIPEEHQKKLWGLQLLGFKLLLKVDTITGNTIRLKVAKFTLFNPNQKNWDWLLIYSLLSNRIQEELAEVFSKIKSPFKFHENIKYLDANMDFFINDISGLMGNIGLDFCQFSKKSFVLYIHSSLLLRSLLDLFGPKYLLVEQVDPASDVFQLLWEQWN